MLGADLLRCATQAAHRRGAPDRVSAGLLDAGRARRAVRRRRRVLRARGDRARSGDRRKPARIQQANALLSLTRNALFLAGPAVAGVLVATVGPGMAFAADAVTFAVSAAFLARMRLPRARARPRTTFAAELRTGWREVRGRTWVWTSIAYFSIWNLALGPLFVLGPFVAQKSLGGATSWGVIVACAGVGSLVGAAVALRLRPRRPLATGFLLFGMCALEAGAPRQGLFPTAVVAAAAALGFGPRAFGGALWFTALQGASLPVALACQRL